MKRLALKDRSGNVRAWACVDDEDFVRLSGFNWALTAGGSSTGGGYAKRVVSRGRDNPPQTILLHREIMGLSLGDFRQVDHINGNRLDNRRQNLRLVSVAEQRQNQPSRGGSSRFRGVSWHAAVERWEARVKVGGVHVLREHFDSEIEAARAAEEARMKYMPAARPDPELAHA